MVPFCASAPAHGLGGWGAKREPSADGKAVGNGDLTRISLPIYRWRVILSALVNWIKGNKEDRTMLIVRRATAGSYSLLITILILISPLSLAADAERPIQWREGFVTVDADLREVEGHEGHAVGLMQQRGFAFYEDGDVATVNAWLTFERSGAETNYRGYAVYTFMDGTTKTGRFIGTGDPRGKQTGKFTIEGGSGRYEGITGEGTFTGRAFPPQGDIYLDVHGTYSIR